MGAGLQLPQLDHKGGVKLTEGKQAQFDLPVETVQKRPRVAARKRANDLDGATWTRYSVSIWSDIKKTPEEMNLGHPAIFPKELPKRLLQCFTTRDDETVLDPFVGVGSTLLAAEEMGKVGIGLDVYHKFVEKCNQRLSQTRIEEENDSGRIPRSVAYEADARNLMEYVSPSSIDFVITSPPYWDIHLQGRTADYKESRPYGELKTDLGKSGDYGDFLKSLREIFELVYETLKPAKYCVIVVMDVRKKDKLYPLHSDITSFMQDIGFIYDDLIIWDRRHEYNNMRPLGYPARFRVNRAHEYILIFQKPK